MIALIQRVAEAARLAERVIGYRIFADAAGKMNLSLAGVFGAEMQVSLVNDGPVTFWLQVRPERAGV